MFAVQAADVTGAGASFPYPIYAKWASDYKAATNNAVNYQSIGSGGGQQQIIAKTVDFGASDDPMKAADLEKNGLLQFPAVIGGTVAVVNIDGVEPGKLKLSGKVLGDIFLGKIKKWDDNAIKALNPDVKLPSADIIVVHRSDGSGTTFGWTNYLSKVSPEWKEQVGEGKAVKWPTGQGAARATRRRLRRPAEELDRLRRIRLRQAEQAGLDPTAEQGWQVRPARAEGLRRRGRQRRLEERARHGRGADR